MRGDEPEKGGLGRPALSAIGLVVLAGALAVSAYWLRNRPTPTPRERSPKAALIVVQTVRPRDETVLVTALGTVEPVTTIALSPRVGGEVVELSDAFVPGGYYRKGEAILKIDPTDYELALKQSKASVLRQEAELARTRSEVARLQTQIVSADAALAIEQGQQAVAKQEYEMLGGSVDEEDEALVLRRPQLEAAQATCDAARAAKVSAEASVKSSTAQLQTARLAVEMATLDLQRTVVRSPLNAVVASRGVDLGSQVTQTTPLVTLIGTDEYWVDVSVPVDALRWLSIPVANGDVGSIARIYYDAAWGEGVFRAGRVVRMKPALETAGRMARLQIAVRDPLGLASSRDVAPRMILGAYVRAEIEGQVLENVVRIPRAALRDGNQVWVMALADMGKTSEGVLEIRDVEPVWSTNEYVLVKSGLREGEQLVVSDIATPVKDMPLRVRSNGNDSATGTLRDGE
jgi:multidrug resistance efflux pump